MELSYVDYGKYPAIGVDIETKDPMLKEKGTGVYRRDGHILGVSFSNGHLAEYYPIGHLDTTPEETEKNLRFIRDQLLCPNRKVFANAMYDLDWLTNYQKLEVNGPIDDVQIAEPLIDENRGSYSLNSLGEKYLQQGKESDEILDYCRQQGWSTGVKSTGREHLWRMPQEIVAKYGATDSLLTMQVLQAQMEELEKQGLLELYNLETRLIPLLLQMRRQGVRLNKDKLVRVGMELSDIGFDLQEELNKLANDEVNPNSGKDLERLFKKEGVPVTYGEPTDLMYARGITKGNPKFDKQTLSRIQHPLATKVLELRHIKTLLNLFIHPYPEFMVSERIHCNFNQLKSDEYGTVSGRFSSSNPNLQQVSSKKEEEFLTSYSGELLNGKIVRKLFIPEEDCAWVKFDWSQIEYRLIAHYALGEGAERIRQRYNEDPNTDYHDELGKMAGIADRKIVKTLNFGAAYGMGIKKMSATYGWDLDEAEEVYYRYHEKVPFVKETSNRVAVKAKRTGFIRTILGRRARLVDSSKGYVMFNRLIQGSAADLMKKAMVDAYEAGIYNVLFPHLTVHDELDQSVPRTKEGAEAANELKNIMEECVTLKVPIKADMEVGPNWGELDKMEKLEW